MIAYFDTGILLKAYVAEKDSAAADAMILEVAAPIPFTHLHEIELRTALRVKRGRGEIADGELKLALRDLQEDINAGRLKKPIYDLPDVFRKAEELSAKHATATLCRSLDILHVATAVVIGSMNFFTFDARQASLATRAGLKVKTRS